MKRWFLVLTLGLAIILTGCTNSNQHYYERAQLYLGSGDYTLAARLFRDLGEYADSADYALYCDALASIQAEEYELARADLRAIDPFKSSGRYLRYLDAMDLLQQDELAEALTILESLGTFSDSERLTAQIRQEIPQNAIRQARQSMELGNYEAAQAILEGLNGYGESARLLQECIERQNECAYHQAEQLFQTGEYAQAMAAFDALGDTLDAAQQAKACRETLYGMLTERCAQAEMSALPDIAAGFEALGDYRDSAEKAALLREQSRVTGLLVDKASEHPYIRLSDRVWRVLRVNGDHVTLLAEELTEPTATATDLAGQDDHAYRLPMASDLAMMDAEMRSACAAWPLGDQLPGGMRLTMQDGRLVINNTPETGGAVRLAAELRLRDLNLTAGEGTKTDPFR